MSQTHSEKILIIEADDSFGQNISDGLHALGFQTTLIKNGVDGLKAIYDSIPHLILLDISLPGVDGYEILAKKNAESMLSRIPVFLLSMQGVPINMRQVPEGSVAQYIMGMHSDVKQVIDHVNAYFGDDSPKSPAVQVGAGSGGKKILWVEDDKLIGTILGKKLLASGFSLIHAVNGEQALKEAASMLPDGIILDLLLPGMNGFDILQKMHMDERLKNVPVMILSNLNKPSDFEKARMLGAKKFLIKAGTSLDEIVKEVGELVR